MLENSQDTEKRNSNAGKILQLSTRPSSAATKATPQAPKNPLLVVQRISPTTMSSGETGVSMIV